MFEWDAGAGRQNQQRRESASHRRDDFAHTDALKPALFVALYRQHFQEHLDKLFAKGIGLLGEALAEAFTILSDVSLRTAEPSRGVERFIYLVNRVKDPSRRAQPLRARFVFVPLADRA